MDVVDLKNKRVGYLISSEWKNEQKGLSLNCTRLFSKIHFFWDRSQEGKFGLFFLGRWKKIITLCPTPANEGAISLKSQITRLNSVAVPLRPTFFNITKSLTHHLDADSQSLMRFQFSTDSPITQRRLNYSPVPANLSHNSWATRLLTTVIT